MGNYKNSPIARITSFSWTQDSFENQVCQFSTSRELRLDAKLENQRGTKDKHQKSVTTVYLKVARQFIHYTI